VSHLFTRPPRSIDGRADNDFVYERLVLILAVFAIAIASAIATAGGGVGAIASFVIVAGCCAGAALIRRRR
jgi:hypothetical protein